MEAEGIAQWFGTENRGEGHLNCRKRCLRDGLNEAMVKEAKELNLKSSGAGRSENP